MSRLTGMSTRAMPWFWKQLHPLQSYWLFVVKSKKGLRRLVSCPVFLLSQGKSSASLSSVLPSKPYLLMSKSLNPLFLIHSGVLLIQYAHTKQEGPLISQEIHFAFAANFSEFCHTSTLKVGSKNKSFYSCPKESDKSYGGHLMHNPKEANNKTANMKQDINLHRRLYNPVIK